MIFNPFFMLKKIAWGWKDASNTPIYAQGWLPASAETRPLKAVILLQHGLGEHSGRYAHVAEFFVANNIAVLANDRSGHGQSGNKRGHIAKYEYTLAEIEQLHNEASRRFPQIPVFLYGHSMGGGIVLNYLLRRKNSPLKGIIATAPLIRPAFQPSKFALFLGKIMRNIWGGFVQNNQLDASKICRNPAVVKAYQADKWVHSRISAETAIGMLQWGEFLLETKHNLALPLYITHSRADALTSFAATQQFVAQSTGDIHAKWWDAPYHEIHNETEEQQPLFADILAWINAHL